MALKQGLQPIKMTARLVGHSYDLGPAVGLNEDRARTKMFSHKRFRLGIIKIVWLQLHHRMLSLQLFRQLPAPILQIFCRDADCHS